LAVKWIVYEPEVKKMIEDVEYFKTLFILYLGVDSKLVSHLKDQKFSNDRNRKKTDEMAVLQIQMVESLGALMLEHENEKKSAIEERASRSNHSKLP
jgi:hypothetical protein